MTLTQIRSLFQPGQNVRVTNHYINRIDHPCYGTQTRTIARVTSSHLHFTSSGSVPWPRAAQIQAEGGIVRMFGGGGGQQPTDLFLTIHTSPDAPEPCPQCGGELQVEPQCVIEEQTFRYLTSTPQLRQRLARAVLCTACEFCEERSGK